MARTPSRRRAGFRALLRLRWICVCLTLIFVAPAFPVSPVSAQEGGGFELELIGQPVWHRPGDRIKLAVRVTNNTSAPLDGFNLVLGAFFRVLTRSELHASFDLADQEAVDSFPLTFVNKRVGPQESVVVRVDEPLANFSLLSQTGEGGVYPLKLILQDGAGQPLDTLSTQLLFYPERPETTLKAVVVLPIDLPPQRGPDGVFHPDSTGAFALEEALGSNLQELVDLLQTETNPRSGPGLEIALAPTPLLIDEIADMADGYRRDRGGESVNVGADFEGAVAANGFLDRFSAVVESSNVQTLNVPYSAPDLPSIAAQPNAIDTQLETGADVVSGALGIEASREWVFGPGGRMDERSVEQSGMEHAFFSADSFVPPDDPLASGCPQRELSFTCPVATTSSGGDRITGYLSDEALQNELFDVTRPGHSRLELQRFFSETAMIREEQPSNSDRIIQITIPPTWRLTGRELSILLRALRNPPWLQSVTPDHGLARTEERATNRRLVPQAQALANQPDELYFENVQRVAELVAHFDSIEPPDSMVRRLNQNILVGQSHSWWDDITSGEEFLSGTEQEIRRELAKIGIVGGNELEIALTSREGEIPLTIFRNTGYAVRINIVLDSSRLDLEQNVLEQNVDSARQRVQFEVIARSSGQFPLDVRLTTPDGYEFGDVKRITIRSTAFNEIALGITFGALAFLILFYVVRGTRRRRAGTPSEQKAESA
jgi:hypothetical protein